MATGYIVTNVYTSRAQIPLRGAQVSITSGTGTNSQLLGFRTTDESGQTEPVSINTPNLELSLSPSKIVPFAICDIKISHPSYYTLTITNVQIFANTQTIQNVELIPLVENSLPEDRFISRNTPSQNL